jgi:hypothetical protein
MKYAARKTLAAIIGCMDFFSLHQLKPFLMTGFWKTSNGT